MFLKDFPFASTLLIITLITLGSCGGGNSDDSSVLEPEDLSLESLDIEGYNIDFDKDFTGPYEVEIDSQTNSLRFQAVTNNQNTELFYLLRNGEESTDQIPIESGENVSIELEEGNTILQVLVANEEQLNYVSYSVFIRKLSSSANLSALQLFTDDEELDLTPDFSPDNYNYSAQVGYSECSYALRFISARDDNLVTLADQTVDSYEFIYNKLEIGENYIDLFVTSGDGQRNDRYSVQVKRSEPTENQINANARLRNLEIQGHEINFYCSQNIYVINVNSTTESIVLTAESEVDGVSIFHGDNDIESGVPIEIPLEDGSSVIQIDSHSLSGAQSEKYQIYINRLNTNRVYVDSMQALQEALKNAEPNDEIRVLPGIYRGIHGINHSGSANAAFFSSRSGTALLPIHLMADDPSQDTVLQTLDDTVDVLHIEGAHWRITGLSIASGKKAVVLTNATANHLSTLDINDVYESGIELRNSSNNTVVNSSITLTPTTQNAVVPALIRISGTGNEVSSSNNRINRNTLEAPANTYAFYIDNSANHTLIQSNKVSVVTTAENTLALGETHGSNSLVRYNSFYPGPATSTAVIASGNDTNFYQNIIDRNFPTTAILTATNGLNIFAAENYLSWASYDEDEHDNAVYSGSNVTQTERLSPRYKIYLSEAPESCLGLTAHEDDEDFYYVQIKPCADTTDFHWEFHFSSDRYVYIKNIAVDDAYLMPRPDFTSHCSSIASATGITYLADNVSGYAQQWAIYSDSEGYWFTNKFNTGYALTVGGNTYTSGTPLVACPLVGSARQKFILEEVE